ncbi:MAG TPA: hypothetical protein VE959_31285 [Bryobacteraceae bacterium]|nr:hypothetical protein [Bryobacteraceae bacterium]
MRYWAYFAAKIVVAAATLYGLLALLNWYWPAEPHVFWYIPPRFGYDLGYTLAVLVWFLLCTGALYLVIFDQRYRCRVCLRRLRMPVETGSWSRMLQFGRPRIEYICPYGHGTLKEEELQSFLENPEWTPHSDDFWDELCASSEKSDEP